MAITYDLNGSGTVATISAIRFEIGDTSDGDGVKPNGANFTDVEISYMYGTEGNSTLAGAAHACETLARAWARASDEQAGPLQRSYSQISKAWDKQGIALRQQSGGGVPLSGRALSSRQDGYAYRAGSVEVNP